MTIQRQHSRTTICPCGSGISYLSCCGGALVQPSSEQRNKPRVTIQLKAAAADIEAGRLSKAEARVRGLLAEVPGLLRAMDLLIRLRKQAGDVVAIETLLQRRAALYPNYDVAQFEFAVSLTERGQCVEAAEVLKKLLSQHPHHADAHNLLGQLTIKNMGTLQRAEYHLRQAYYIKPSVATYSINLAHVLRLLARWEEALHFLRIALALEPGNLDALQGWVSIEESRHNLDKAWHIQHIASDRAPDNFRNRLNEALLQRRSGSYDAALTVLNRIDIDRQSEAEQTAWYFERGQVLDKLGRYPEAFSAADTANHLVRQDPARCYNIKKNGQQVAQLKEYFTRDRLEHLPRGRPRLDSEEQPIFIVGFPRSGTSMLEQILSAHPEISGGNELILVQRLTEHAQGWLNSDKPYPYCLDELAKPANYKALQRFRDYYLGELRTLAILDPGTRRFTDKMPLNELHLGMISLAFPEARIVHMLRHPLDIIVSCYFNELQHGDNFAYDLDCAARYYVLVMELVEQYCGELNMHYHRVCYEDLVADVDSGARELLEFVGVSWDPACLEFHNNRRATRTASYAQVTEKVYTHSVNRYHDYRDQLQSVIPLIQPTAERFGYAID